MNFKRILGSVFAATTMLTSAMTVLPSLGASAVKATILTGDVNNDSTWGVKITPTVARFCFNNKYINN